MVSDWPIYIGIAVMALIVCFDIGGKKNSAEDKFECQDCPELERKIVGLEDQNSRLKKKVAFLEGVLYENNIEY